MTTLRSFDAPWSTSLKVVTIFGSIVLLSECVLGLLLPRMSLAGRLMMVTLPPAGIVVAALFTIRGYDLTRDSILVLRLFWKTRVPLAGLQQVTVDPKATKRSLRSFGNGGFFSFTGWYYNKQLGRYRMFATDLERTVVLHFADRRVVMTPDDPEAFVRCVWEKAGLR